MIKATAIDPSVVDADGVYRNEGPARVFTSEAAAIAAIREGRIAAGDVMVLAGIGPMGTGMEETYQVTCALKHLPFGKHVALLTDARFSGVSHRRVHRPHRPRSARRRADRQAARRRSRSASSIDRVQMDGTRRFRRREWRRRFSPKKARASSPRGLAHADLAPHPALPDDTRLWAALQNASGGTWGGCVYDARRDSAGRTWRPPATSASR